MENSIAKIQLTRGSMKGKTFDMEVVERLPHGIRGILLTAIQVKGVTYTADTPVFPLFGEFNELPLVS